MKVQILKDDYHPFYSIQEHSSKQKLDPTVDMPQKFIDEWNKLLGEFREFQQLIKEFHDAGTYD